MIYPLQCLGSKTLKLSFAEEIELEEDEDDSSLSISLPSGEKASSDDESSSSPKTAVRNPAQERRDKLRLAEVKSGILRLLSEDEDVQQQQQQQPSSVKKPLQSLRDSKTEEEDGFSEKHEFEVRRN